MTPRPIEEASKDLHLLLFFPDTGWIEGWWFEGRELLEESGWETVIGFIGEPTHWLPAPADPEGANILEDGDE